MKSKALFLGILAAGLALAGCGDGDSSTSSTTPDSTGTGSSSIVDSDPWSEYDIKTVAEIIELCADYPEDHSEERYYVRGIVSNLDTQYGGMDLTDETGTIMVYGTYSADGELRYSEIAGPKPVDGDEARLGAWAAAGPTGAVERVSLPDKKGLEHTVLKDFSGIALFRRTVEIPDAWAGRDLALHLGSTILPTVAFFNGVCVGRVKTWDAPVPGAAPQAANRFTVRAADVRQGTNTVAVFLGCNDRLSWWSGLYGKLSLSPDGSPEAAIPLAGDAWTCEKLAIPKPGPTQGGSWGARIHPFFKMPVRGVLFYQGEADSRRPAADYLADHKRFIGLLREGWKRPDLPFYFMQLANHARARNGENGFCEVREAQRLTAEQVPHTGMACSIDIGEDRNIHPQNKREQGRRLALQALRKTYGCRDVVAAGPQFRELVRAGRTATVVYKPSSAQLLVKGGVLTGFEARAKGGAWTPVSAEVRDGCVTLTAPFEIEDVRYLWQNYPDPEAVLFDGTGLPAVPFRTCSGDE